MDNKDAKSNQKEEKYHEILSVISELAKEQMVLRDLECELTESPKSPKSPESSKNPKHKEIFDKAKGHAKKSIELIDSIKNYFPPGDNIITRHRKSMIKIRDNAGTNCNISCESCGPCESFSKSDSKSESDSKSDNKGESKSEYDDDFRSYCHFFDYFTTQPDILLGLIFVSNKENNEANNCLCFCGDLLETSCKNAISCSKCSCKLCKVNSFSVFHPSDRITGWTTYTEVDEVNDIYCLDCAEKYFRCCKYEGINCDFLGICKNCKGIRCYEYPNEPCLICHSVDD